MIQDIGEHSFRIEYIDRAPDSNSKVMFFNNGKLLVIHVSEKEHDIDYPEYDKISEQCKELTYLFSLDDTAYCRCELKENEAEIIRQTLSQKGMRATFENRSFFRQVRPNALALVSITGMHLNGWYEKTVFCGACAHKLIHDQKERMMRCPSCGNMIFPRINPAVIVAVTHEDKVLVTRYKDREYKNLALIAGFNEIGESLEETVRREVMEEAGIKVKNIKYYKSQPWGFADNILVGYFCEADGNTDIVMDEEELSMAKWIKRSEIPINTESFSLTWEMINSLVDK